MYQPVQTSYIEISKSWNLRFRNLEISDSEISETQISKSQNLRFRNLKISDFEISKSQISKSQNLRFRKSQISKYQNLRFQNLKISDFKISKSQISKNMSQLKWKLKFLSKKKSKILINFNLVKDNILKLSFCVLVTSIKRCFPDITWGRRVAYTLFS